MTLSVLLFVGASWLFGGVAEDVLTDDPLVQVDRQISQWFRVHQAPVLTHWLSVVTDAHGVVGIGIMGLALGLYLLWRRERYWLLALAVVLPGGMLMNVLLKLAFRRDRPLVDDPLRLLSGYSFPSGHVSAATLFYGLLAAFVASKLPSWGLRVLAWLAATVLVLLVAATRVYLGAHYFSDVVAAAAWGTAWLVMCQVAIDALRRSNSRGTTSGLLR